MRTCLLLLFCLAVTPLLRGQLPPPVPTPFVAHTAAELNQVEAQLKLRAAATPSGEAEKILEDQGTNWILMVARAHTGEAELSRDWSQEILVRSGTLTLFYGGSMSDEHAYGPRVGDFRSATMAGGTALVMHAGDLMHIPAAVSVWVKIAPGDSATYLIFKEL